MKNVKDMKFCKKFVRGAKFSQTSPSHWSSTNKGYEIFGKFFQKNPGLVEQSMI